MTFFAIFTISAFKMQRLKFRLNLYLMMMMIDNDD